MKTFIVLLIIGKNIYKKVLPSYFLKHSTYLHCNLQQVLSLLDKIKYLFKKWINIQDFIFGLFIHYIIISGPSAEYGTGKTCGLD